MTHLRALPVLGHARGTAGPVVNARVGTCTCVVTSASGAREPQSRLARYLQQVLLNIRERSVHVQITLPVDSAFVSVSMLSSIEASAGTEFFNHSGGQYRSFKMGPDFPDLYFSDAGVFNVDTTADYFVICPLDWSGGTADAANPSSTVTVEYRDNNSTKAVSCNWVMENVLGALALG